MPGSASLFLYYIHHHGTGHLQRARFLLPLLQDAGPVEILIASDSFYSAVAEAFPRLTIHRLNPKWDTHCPPAPRTFDRAFEGMPFSSSARQRGATFLTLLYQRNVTHFISDVSAELTIQARSAGVRCLMQRHSGDISNDPTQVFAYQCADALFAPYPAAIESQDYAFSQKTGYLGFITQPVAAPPPCQPGVTIVHSNARQVATLCAALQQLDIPTTVIGCTGPVPAGVRWLGQVGDVSAAITTQTVICSGGNNLVSELSMLGKSLIILPEPRPYDEQQAKAQGLARAGWAQLLTPEAISQPDQLLAQIKQADSHTCTSLPAQYPWAESFRQILKKVI